MKNKVLSVVLCFKWIFFAIGLECPCCLHVATGNATPTFIRDMFDPYFKNFSDPNCATDIDGHQNQVKMKSCDEVPEEIILCGHFSGQVTLIIPMFNFPKVLLTFTHRDCYNFTKSEVPQIGCMNRTNEAVDIKEVNKSVSAMAKHGSFLTGITVESVIGEMCLNADTTTTVTPKNSAKALFRKDQFIEFILFLVYCCMFLF